MSSSIKTTFANLHGQKRLRQAGDNFSDSFCEKSFVIHTTEPYQKVIPTQANISAISGILRKNVPHQDDTSTQFH